MFLLLSLLDLPSRRLHAMHTHVFFTIIGFRQSFFSLCLYLSLCLLIVLPYTLAENKIDCYHLTFDSSQTIYIVCAAAYIFHTFYTQ